jgi:hypothetical protein
MRFTINDKKFRLRFKFRFSTLLYRWLALREWVISKLYPKLNSQINDPTFEVNFDGGKWKID